MGAVYLARDQRLERDVAIKVIAPDLLDEENARKRFRRESLAVSKLNHPNVEMVFDVGTQDGTDFIVLEYIPGTSLDEMVDKGPLPVAKVVAFGQQMLAGLASAHEGGILHRDLKPSNLRASPSGQLKILDFGLARSIIAEPDSLTETLLSTNVQGTVPYMSPEQLRGGAVDQRSDIFAAGCVLYELATGKRPFEGRTQAEIIDKILNRQPLSPRSERPEVPKRLNDAIMRALEKDPARRFSTANDFAQELATPGALNVRRRSIAVPVLVALLILAVGFGIWRLRPPQSHPESAAVITGKASNMELQLGSGGKPSAVPEANDIYKRALLLVLTQSNVPKSRELLRDALRLDPNFAQARAWYGFTDLLMIDSGLSNDSSWVYASEKEVRKALEQDPQNARAHSALAAIYFYQARLPEMLEEIRKAKEYGAEYDTSVWLGLYHQLRGEYGKSNAVQQEILDRNEFFFPARMNIAENHREVGDYSTCIQEDQKILDIDPNNMYALSGIAYCRMDAGDIKGARQIMDKGWTIPSLRTNFQMRIPLALLLAEEGKKKEAMKAMDPDVVQYAKNFPSFQVFLADFYALIGDKKQAIDALQRSVQLGDDRAAFFKLDPMLKNIQSEPRFLQLIDSIEYRVKHRSG